MAVFSSLVKKRSILQSNNPNSSSSSTSTHSKPQVGKLQKSPPNQHQSSASSNHHLPNPSNHSSDLNHPIVAISSQDHHVLPNSPPPFNSLPKRSLSTTSHSTHNPRTSSINNRTSLFLDLQHSSHHPPRSSSIHRKQPMPPPLPPMPDLQHLSTHSNQPLKSPCRLIPRKSRQTPTLNLVLAGSTETGKTSFLETILGTFGISSDSLQPSVTSNGIQHHSIGTVPGLNGDRIALTIIDTPSLEILSNDELKVEHQVNDILRCIESKFEHTLKHEQQVKREPIRLSDTHVHCCLYFLHPSIIEPAQRASNSKHPSITETTRISMAKMDIRAMKRIGKRANVLPVIGRSDELTVQQLSDVRAWLRTEMRQSAIDLGLFTGTEETDSEVSDEPEAITTASSQSSLSHNSQTHTQAVSLKTRRKSLSVTASLSNHPKRTRCTLTQARAEEALSELLPLSLINPEKAYPLSSEEVLVLNKMNPLDFNHELQSVGYLRRFRWAQVDVLDPKSCEFGLLRSVLFGTHLTKLKEITRLEKYESFRTERLIRRERFTKLITSDQQVELMKEMDNIMLPSATNLVNDIHNLSTFDHHHHHHHHIPNPYEPIVL